MKKLFIIISVLFVITIVSCEKCSISWPDAPYGTPDDKNTYINGNYRSITYIYYCYNGKYISVTYTQVDECEKWDKSDFVSSGICY